MSVYRIGMEIALTNNVSKALGVIAADMMGLIGLQHKVAKGFSAMNMAVVGMASAFAGFEIAKGLLHIEKAAEKLVHAETALAVGLPATSRAMDMQTARTAAYAEAGKNLNSTLSGNIEHMHDLYNVVLDMNHAAHLLPTFNKLSNAFSFVTDEGAKSHGADGKQLAMAARALEMSGRTTTESIEKVIPGYIKSVIALRGRVTGSDFMQAVSGAGDARYSWNDEFLTAVLPALANIMKGRTNAGQGLYHLNNNLFGGVASSYAQARMQEKWGLHSVEDEVRDPVTKKFQGFKVGTVWGADKLSQNPLDWANEYRAFLKDKKGVNIDDIDTMRRVVGEIGRGNKLLKSMLDELLLPQTNRQFNKERENILKVGDDALGIMNQDDPKMWRKKLADQWQNLEEAWGKEMVPAFIHNVLEPLTYAARDLSQWALANPGSVKLITDGLIGLSAFLMAGGAAAILAAIGPVGWLVGGIAALGAVAYANRDKVKEFTSWAGRAWRGEKNEGDLNRQAKADKVRDGWRLAIRQKAVEVAIAYEYMEKVVIDKMTSFAQSIRNSVNAVKTAIAAIGQKFIDAIMGLPGMVAGAIHDAIAKIAAEISSAISGLWGKLKNLSPISAPGATPGGGAINKAAINATGGGGRGRHFQVTVNSILDGKAVARAVSQRIVAGMEHPTSAPFHDGWRGWSPPDMQTVTT